MSSGGTKSAWDDSENDTAFEYCVAHDAKSRTILLTYELSRPAEVKLFVCNVQGVVLRSANQHGSCGENLLQLNYGMLTPGRYVICIENDSCKFTEKFIVA